MLDIEMEGTEPVRIKGFPVRVMDCGIGTEEPGVLYVAKDSKAHMLGIFLEGPTTLRKMGQMKLAVQAYMQLEVLAPLRDPDYIEKEPREDWPNGTIGYKVFAR